MQLSWDKVASILKTTYSSLFCWIEISALGQIMAWCWTGSKQFTEDIMVKFTDAYMYQPQPHWINDNVIAIYWDGYTMGMVAYGLAWKECQYVMTSVPQVSFVFILTVVDSYKSFLWKTGTSLSCTDNSPIARFMVPTWGPPGAGMTPVGPMLATWTMLSGIVLTQCAILKHRDY